MKAAIRLGSMVIGSYILILSFQNCSSYHGADFTNSFSLDQSSLNSPSPNLNPNPFPNPGPTPGNPPQNDSKDSGDTGIGSAGIASKYPGDANIASDPDVVFAENFENGNWDDIRKRWDNTCSSTDPNHFCYNWHNNMQFSSDVPPGSAGKRSYYSNGSSDMYKMLKPKDGKPGFERLFVRFYAKITNSAQCSQIHHWPWIGGHDPPTSFPWPRAGTTPNSEDPNVNTAGRFSTGVETSATAWTWDFYSYWPSMLAGGDNMWWGNTFNAYNTSGFIQKFPVQRQQWVSIELMIKLNEFGKVNGEQAFWINGELKSYVGSAAGRQIRGVSKGGNFVSDPNGPLYPGIEWRKTRPNLMINYFWLEHFVDTDPDCVAWFDDVVVARKYIGPIK